MCNIYIRYCFETAFYTRYVRDKYVNIVLHPCQIYNIIYFALPRNLLLPAAFVFLVGSFFSSA